MNLKRLIYATALLPAMTFAQINTERVMNIGRNALYFEDYVLSIQYFNQVINAKPYLCEPYFFRGLAKLNLEDYIGAEKDCSKAIDCNPYVVSSYQVRGLARINLNEFDGAIQDYRMALKYDPENISVWHNMSLCYMEKKDYEAADKTLDTLLHLSPRNSKAYMLKSVVNMEKKDTVMAMQYIDKSIEIDPYDGDSWSTKAILQLQTEKYREAEESLTQAIRLSVRNVPNYINRAMARYNTNNLRGAMSDYDIALSIEPNNFIGRYNRGLLRAQLGDDNRAIEDFNVVLQQKPDDMMAVFNRALLYDKTGDLYKAIQDYSTVLGKYPQFAYGYQKRAEAYRKTGQTLAAKKDEDKLLKMALDEHFGDKNKKTQDKETRTESDKDVRNFNKLVIAEDEGERKYQDKYRGKVQNTNVDIRMMPLVAVNYYEQYDEIMSHINYNNKIDSLNKRGVTARPLILTTRERAIDEDEMNMHFSSINALSAAIDKDRSNAMLRFRRAIDYYLVQDFYNALEDLDAAIKIDPRFSTAYFVRAFIRCKQLEYERSEAAYDFGQSADKKAAETKNTFIAYESIRKDMNTVIELEPDFCCAYYNRACILAMLKDFRGALNDLNKAIELDNKFPEAYYNRGLINVFLGNDKQGISDLSKAGELGIAQAYNIIKRFMSSEDSK